MKKIEWKKLVVSLLVAQMAGGIGATATTPKIKNWYLLLQKPSFSPPNRLFGPVWTLLFLMMGAAFYLIWTSKKKDNYNAKNWFFVQLGLNVMWSFLFFGMENPGLGLVEIVLLWGAILATISSFGKISKTASRLLIPYLGWVSFATILNAAIWWLNK